MSQTQPPDHTDANGERSLAGARVCVTGAGGFVAGYLVPALASSGAGVYGTVHTDQDGVAARRAGLTDVVVADVLDTEAMQRAVEPATHVVHLAAVSSGAAGPEAFRVNVDGTRNVLRACSGKRVLLASTGYVYGPVPPERPAQEDDPLNPFGAYAQSKAAMEQMASEEFAGDDIVIARAFNHTGPGQTDAFAVPAFARQIAEIEAGHAEPVLSVGNLDALREMMDVRDVVRAYVALLAAPSEAGRVFNVASGCPHPMHTLVDMLLAMARTAIRVETDPNRLRPSDVPCSTGDPARLEATTGWRPRIALESLLRDTLDWWRVQAGTAA